jgi:hypothetical protein
MAVITIAVVEVLIAVTEEALVWRIQHNASFSL